VVQLETWLLRCFTGVGAFATVAARASRAFEGSVTTGDDCGSVASGEGCGSATAGGCSPLTAGDGSLEARLRLAKQGVDDIVAMTAIRMSLRIWSLHSSVVCLDEHFVLNRWSIIAEFAAPPCLAGDRQPCHPGNSWAWGHASAAWLRSRRARHDGTGSEGVSAASTSNIAAARRGSLPMHAAAAR